MGVVAPETDVQTAQSDGRTSVVLLTTGARMAATILDALDRRGIRPDAILLERPRPLGLLSRVRRVWRRRGARATLGAIRGRLIGMLRPRREPWRTSDFYAPRTGRLIRVESLGGDDAAGMLREMGPDLLLLAGAPVLPATLLQVPRVGTLNAHPGLLPRYRGVDVVAHAVLDGGPIGATVHFVDAGIDTGGIVSRVEVPTRPGDSLASLQERVEAAGADALAEAVHRLLLDGELQAERQPERHRICRSLSPAQRRAAEARLGERRE